MAPFQPSLILATLAKHGVKHVVIGGLAGALHGSPLVTQDADICPDRSPDNLVRLATALRELNPRIRTEGVEDGLAFACDEKFFRQVALANLVTDAGDLDVAFEPTGTTGYQDLAVHQVVLKIDGIDVAVASLADVIRSKTATNRPKDRAALPILLELVHQIELTSKK